MTDLYQSYNDMVNLRPSDDTRRDDKYTYYPYVHADGEPAYEDASGFVWYRVPNEKVGLQGMANQAMAMGKNVYDSMRDEAMGYYNWFQDPDKFAAQREGLERMADGARNIFGNSRAYAEDLTEQGPYSEVPQGRRYR